MIHYRHHEFGIEKIEEGRSTFIAPEPDNAAWRDYLTWTSKGIAAIEQPARPFFHQVQAPKRLLIIGAGTYGRELYWMSRTARGAGIDWTVEGFLSDVPDSLDTFPGFPPIVGPTDYAPGEHDVFICAIGDPGDRDEVTRRIRARGGRFLNLIQPSALISGDVELGEGVIIESFVGIGTNTRIGDFCSVLGHVNIGHDVTIGNCVQLSPFACILGRADIGDNVLIGSHAVIFPGIKVGTGATVGAGAIAISHVAPGTTVFGNPAKRLG
ncbi:MAG: acetyltransferase [Opitutaceae bacterium]